MTPCRTAWILALALVAPPVARGDETPASVRLEAMRGLARAVAVAEAKSNTPAGLIPEPIYRFDDPARAFGDGSIWAYGKLGRPAAIFCLSVAKNDDGSSRWIHELTSLADGPVLGTSQHPSGAWTWKPKGPETRFQAIPRAPTPADTDTKRLQQMREIARRFKAFESLDPARNDPADRFELRLLPQPIHRYHDPEHGQVDGAIFLLSYGRNPEVALLIEAQRAGKGDPAWSYALARIGAARMRVSLDDREVADLPKPVDAGWTSPYFLFDRPASGLKD